MNLNKVYLIGRLTHDPDVRSTSSGQSVTNLKMATNRVWTDASGQRKDSTEYHTVIAWRRLGEIAAQYLRRGSLVMIEGRIQTRSWTGQDNIRRYSTEIVAESLQLGPRSAQSSQAVSTPATDAKKTPSSEPEIPIINQDEPTREGVVEDEVNIKEKDLPF